MPKIAAADAALSPRAPVVHGLRARISRPVLGEAKGTAASAPPRRRELDGEICPGCFEEAEWIKVGQHTRGPDAAKAT